MFCQLLHAQTEVKMNQQNGVFIIPCKVNGLQLNFIFDTGASDVSISLTEAIFMLKNGYLSEDDLLGTEYYRIANGDVAEGTSIILREVEIGGRKLYNVKASIMHELDAPLLLGQSALSKLGKFNFDYSNSKLTFQGGPRIFNAHKFNSVYYPTETYNNKFFHVGLGGGLERLILNPYANYTVEDGSDNTYHNDSAIVRINGLGLKGELAVHPIISEHFSIGFIGSISFGTRALIYGAKEKPEENYDVTRSYVYSRYNVGGEVAGGFKGAKIIYKINWNWQNNDYSKTYSGIDNYNENYIYNDDFDNNTMSFGLRFGRYARYLAGLRGNSVDLLYTLTKNITPGYYDNEWNEVNGLKDWKIGFGFMWWCQSAFKFQFEVYTDTKHKDLSEINFNNAWYQISLLYNHNWFY
jgi:clan AA aspartic protease (TIGR02281 family)